MTRSRRPPKPEKMEYEGEEAAKHQGLILRCCRFGQSPVLGAYLASLSFKLTPAHVKTLTISELESLLQRIRVSVLNKGGNQFVSTAFYGKLRVPRDADTSAWDEGDYLLHALPDFWAESTVRVNAHNRLRGRSLCTVDELKVFVWIMLAMCVQPLNRRTDYWKARPSAADLFPPADFNRL